MAKYVDGAEEIDRRWAKVPELVRMALRAEMEAQAHKLVDDMYALAPQLTGDLAGSIGWTWGDAPKGSLTIGTVRGKEYGTLRITIYAAGGDAFYGKFQEFGTKNMPANPFFFPAYRARKKKIRSAMRRAVNKAIKQV